MIKWVGLILSFVMGRFNSHAPQSGFNLKDTAMGIFDDITLKSRKAAGLLLGGLGCVILFCGGFFISLIDATRQYDADGAIAMTSTFTAGLVLALVGVGIFTWIFASAWPGLKVSKQKMREEAAALRNPPPSPQPSSIESAVTALIMDFVHEREHNRSTQSHSAPPPMRPHDSTSFNEELPPVYPH
ncbi:MAG: hypothetical protein H7326_00170 [Bdellovibrionaceae bacterium]|nr:hypothetical protein [Pseudobdellovibrionaceae bacterium]